MNKYKVTYRETIVREVDIVAPDSSAVQKRFDEGNFNFNYGFGNTKPGQFKYDPITGEKLR